MSILNGSRAMPALKKTGLSSSRYCHVLTLSIVIVFVLKSKASRHHGSYFLPRMGAHGKEAIVVMDELVARGNKNKA